MSESRVQKKYANVRVYQAKQNQKKLVFKPTEPLHLNFNIDYDPKLLQVLNKKLDLESKTADPNKPRLFHMRSEDNKMEYHNMQLTKIIFNCRDCQFEHRITKLNIDKCMRTRKQLKTEIIKKHVQENKGHKILVSQTFEQWRPFRS